MYRVYAAWATPLADPDCFRRGYQMVSPARQQKIDMYRFDRDRRLSLAASLLLLQGLRELGISHPEFSIAPGGKPYLVGESLRFNLSHSGQRVMCVISDGDVGCDVEQMAPVELEIARRFFFSTEYTAIADQPDPPSRWETFFRLWTLKESFMKVTGLGLRLGLDSFRIDLTDPISIHQQFDTRRYYFREYDLHDGYRYAVCGVAGPIGPLVEVTLG